MKRASEIEKLLGGWAAGTLTEAERRALMEAALEDQALFDRLAGEQLLKETLEDPALRARVYAAAAEHRAGLWEAVWRRPWTWGVAGLAAASVLIFSAVRWQQMAAYRAAPVQNTRLQETEPAPAAAVRPAAAAPEREAPADKRRRAEAGRPLQQPRQFDIASVRRKSEPAVLPSPPALPAAPPAAAGAGAARQSAILRPPSELASAPPPPAPAAAKAPAATGYAARPVAGGAPGGVIGGIISPRPSSAERKETAAKSAPPAGARVFVEHSPSPPALRLARSPAGPALVLRCRILRRDAGGSYVQADPGKALRARDSLRVAFQVNDRAQVSIATPAGVLWTGTVSQGREESVSIPAGTARLVITASRDTLVTPVRTPAPAAGEEVPQAAGTVYLSRTAASPEGPVVAEITLKYE